MGRSQIYVRFENERGEKELIARFIPWDDSLAMISRARSTIEWIKRKLEKSYSVEKFCNLMRDVAPDIMEVNLDTKQVTISYDIIHQLQNKTKSTLQKFSQEFLFKQDNDDGKLLIDIIGSEVKYIFLTNDNEILNPSSYLDWNDPTWQIPSEYNTSEEIKQAANNMSYLAECSVMTSEEVVNFLTFDYSKQLEEDYE